MSADIAAHWDSAATRYDRAYESPGRGGRFLRSRRASVVRLLGDGPGKVLDVGMGPGRMLEALAARGWRVSGVDVSGRMVAVARERLPRARGRLLQAPLECIPFPDASFDAVIATGVLGYAGWSEAALARLSRLLRPGGLAVLSLPNRWCLPRLWRHLLVYSAARAGKRIVPFGRSAPLPGQWPPGRRRFEDGLEAVGLTVESRRYASFSLRPLALPFPRAGRTGSEDFESSAVAGMLLAGQLVYGARKPSSGV